MKWYEQNLSDRKSKLLSHIRIWKESLDTMPITDWELATTGLILSCNALNLIDPRQVLDEMGY